MRTKIGKLFIISGQSGVGKNTLIKDVLKLQPDLHKVITYTTRDPRPSEVPNVDHFFVYKEKFAEMIKNNEFIEYAKVHDEMYGTPKKQVEDILALGKNALMEIDVQGAKQVKEIMPDAVLIFIKYEDGNLEENIRRRLNNDSNRGKVLESDILKRLESAQKEKQYEKYYDYSVINYEGNPQLAVLKILNIIKGKQSDK